MGRDALGCDLPVGLHRPRCDAAAKCQHEHQRRTCAPPEQRGGGLLEHLDSLLEWMGQSPVATQRQRVCRQLRLEHRLAIGAARSWVAGDHALVAGEFLVVSERPGSGMQQGVEPEHAAQHQVRGIGLQVAVADVGLLMGQHQSALLGAVAGVEIGGQHDQWLEQADRSRQPGNGVGPMQSGPTCLQRVRALRGNVAAGA